MENILYDLNVLGFVLLVTAEEDSSTQTKDTKDTTEEDVARVT